MIAELPRAECAWAAGCDRCYVRLVYHHETRRLRRILSSFRMCRHLPPSAHLRTIRHGCRTYPLFDQAQDRTCALPRASIRPPGGRGDEARVTTAVALYGIASWATILRPALCIAGSSIPNAGAGSL